MRRHLSTALDPAPRRPRGCQEAEALDPLRGRPGLLVDRTEIDIDLEPALGFVARSIGHRE